jgi:hypothetical protein
MRRMDEGVLCIYPFIQAPVESDRRHTRHTQHQLQCHAGVGKRQASARGAGGPAGEAAARPEPPWDRHQRRAIREKRREGGREGGRVALSRPAAQVPCAGDGPERWPPSYSRPTSRRLPVALNPAAAAAAAAAMAAAARAAQTGP